MKRDTSTCHSFKVFVASLVSYVLLTSQLAPIAIAFNSSPIPKVAGRSSAVARESAAAKSRTASDPSRAVLPAPVPVPLMITSASLAPTITATKVDTYASAPGPAVPGEIIQYTITINNSGPDAATNVTLSDTVDPNTAIVGTPKSTPIAFNDAFSVLGNVRILVPDGAQDLLANDRDPDTDTNAGMTITTLAGDASAPFAGTSTNGGQVTATTGDGSFQYNPPPGFTGSDTFSYTATDADGGTSSATVTLTINGMIWFVNAAAPAGGDGRLTNPFNCLVGAGCFDPVAADDPGDNIFLFTGNYPDTGALTLLNNQQLFGQGASGTLEGIIGIVLPPHSDALPVLNGNPATVTVTSTAGGVVLGTGNTLRGFTIGNTAGAKVSNPASPPGGSFGTLLVREMILNGNGQALNLDNGALDAIFNSISSNLSAGQGINLDQVSGSLAVNNGTTITDPTTQGILVTASTANIDFGNTGVTDATDGISLQNNSAGTRTFGTLSVTNGSGVGFLHSGGGGATTAGVTTITNPGGIGVSINNSTTTVTFGNTNITQSGGTGVSVSGGSGNVTFGDLDISPDAGQRALQATSTTGTITAGSGTISSTNQAVVDIVGVGPASPTPLNITLDSLSSIDAPAAAPAINVVNTTGTFTATTATVTNPGGIGIGIASAVTTVGGGYGFNTANVTSSGGTGVVLQNNTKAVGFNILNISPDANQIGLQVSGSAGATSTSNGTITTTDALALTISNSAISMGLTSVSADNTGDTDSCVSFTNVTGAISLNAGALTGGTAAAFSVSGGTLSANMFGTITQASNAAMVDISGGHNTGTITFQSTLSATNGTGLQFNDADGTYNFNGTNTLNGGDAGIDIVSGSSGSFSFSANTTLTHNGAGTAFNLNGSNANITYSGSITDDNGRAVDVDNHDAGTITFNTGSINAGTANASGIRITNSNGGSVNFDSQTTLNTSANTAVDLGTNNGGGVMNFNAGGNGLDITTTSGVGFLANGGGVVQVLGSGNTINSSSGIALNLANTTIGGSNVTFLSISAGNNTGAADPANGIILNNTGAAGRLIVTGDGNTAVGGNSSGGTIQSTTSHAISLTNTTNPSFTNINIQNAGGGGIDGTTTTDFTLANSTINNVGTAAAGQYDESNIGFNDAGAFTNGSLTGTISITQNVLTNARRHGIQIENGTGTINNLTISNNTITSSTNAASSLGSGVLILTQGSAATTAHFTTGSINTNSINNFPSGAGILIGGGSGNAANNNSATLGANATPINITSNTINGGATRMGTNAIQISFNGQVGVSNFNIINNPLLTNFQGIGITVFMGGTVTGTTIVNANIIVSNQTIGAGSSGIAVQADDGPAGLATSDPDVNFTINNNSISNNEGFGIRAIARATNRATMDVTIQNNNVAAPTLANRNGIRVDSGSAAGDTKVCMVMTGNTSAGSGVNAGLGLRKQGTVANVNEFGIVGLAPSPATGAQAAAKVIADNPLGGGVDIISGSNFVSCAQTAAPVTARRQPPQPVAESAPIALAQAEKTSQDAIAVSNPAPANIPAHPVVYLEGPRTVRAESNVATQLAVKSVAPAAVERPSTPSVKETLPPKPVEDQGGNPPVIGPGGSSITWNVGTLPAGQSVTITFEVQVENPYSGPPQVSNQGTITFGGGGGPVLTDDPSVGGGADPTVTPIAAPPDAFVRNARVAEPTSGTTSMLFTVALSFPATQMTTINYSTANGTAVEPGDYVAATGLSTTFQVGEQLKVIPITVNSDVDGAEVDENFTLTITGNPTVVNIVTPTATGTITAANPPGTVLISEFRTLGPGAANDPNDEFVEIYNNTGSPLTVAASDASPGFGLFKMGVGSCDATPVLIGTIPNGTVIPARGHFLFVGTAYSLSAYAGGNATLTAGIETNANIALFNTTSIINLSTTTRLDAVGEGTNNTNLCTLLAEGNNLPGLTTNLTALGQHSFFRTICNQSTPTCPTAGNPKDTNDNTADFTFVDTNGTSAGSGQRLGAPGPENLASPIRRDSTFGVVLLDASVAGAQPPNRVRDLTSDPPNNSTFGTMSIRRRFVNNTGGNVTRLRVRIIDMTVFPVPAGTADLRTRTSSLVVVSGINDAATCSPNPVPCMVNVQGTTLEQPPTQPNAGGIHSSLAAGTITVGTPLANGASVNLQFLLGVQQTGSFKFFFIIEALP